MIGALTNHLWQSTLFAVLAGLLTLGLRNNPAHVRYWLWFSASFKFFVPFSLLVSLGSQLAWTPDAQKSSTRILTPSISSTMAHITEPFPEFVAFAPSPEATRDWVPVAILALWTFGFAAIAIVRFRGWLRIRSAMGSSSALELAVPIEVRSSPGLLEPGVVGLFRPMLLLPDGIVDRLTPPQLEAVLAHELCHIRRRDNLFASIHMIVEAMFWFHPLVWWIGARLMDERERACDEEVLRLGNEPRVYAEGILNVCKLYVESPLVCVSGVTGSNLKKRIEDIMKNRCVLRLDFARKAVLAVAAIAALTIPIAIGVMNVPAIRAQSSIAAAPKFEAVSIKPCGEVPRFKRGHGYLSSAGTLNTGCVALVEADNLGLIQRAYVRFADGNPPPHWPAIMPIQGGPAWIRSELFNITAKAKGNPSQEMMEGPMMQALLEDRFKLKIHRETREVPVYALTVAPGGLQLTPFQDGSCIAMPSKANLPAPPAGQQYCKVMVSARVPAVHAEGTTLTQFSQLLNLVLDRPVIDRTGITGRFNIQLKFGVDQATPRFLPGGDLATFVEGTPDPAASSIFAAIQLLGLKLEPTQGPSEFLVVDRVEHPKEN